jgi:hypothetical protein
MPSAVQRQIDLTDLVVAVERAVGRSYDDELAQYRTMKRFGWAAIALGLVAVVLTLGDISTYNALAGAFAAFAGFGWFVSRAEWEATRSQIGLLESALAEKKVYIGGRGREVYLTTDPCDGSWGDAFGNWLRGSVPHQSPKQVRNGVLARYLSWLRRM